MRTKLTRRAFFTTSLVAAAIPSDALRAADPLPRRQPDALPAQPVQPAASPTVDGAGLTGYQAGQQVWVRWNNHLLTSYRAHHTQKYPYMFPFAGTATGLSLTSETALPWPHHRSLFFGCDRVNGGDYWSDAVGKHQIVSRGLKLGRTTKETVEILDACDWLAEGRHVVMKDTRRVMVTLANDRMRFIDWEIAWTAVEKVTIQKSNHSLFSIRAAVDITPLGGGKLVNAEAQSGEKATFNQKSAWCAFYGKRLTVAGEFAEGIALMDHPKNRWSPCPWFTRDYGFISPTPFNWIERPWELAAGDSVLLRYRVVAFSGDPAATGLARVYQEWAG